MSDISKIDKNFVINSHFQKEDIRFFDAKNTPFKIYGVFWADGQYRRMPETAAKKVSDEVHRLHVRTAGGRVRFVTDSKCVAISAKMGPAIKVSHFTLAGTSGFDMYVGSEHAHTFMPPQSMENGYEGIAELGTNELREITINFPLYAEVHELFIGLEKDAVLKEASPYKNEKPIVYYGSSITMGGCASRAGTCYQNIVSRQFDCDYINLGFSGSALGEDEMTDYIKSLDMSAFVMDYDHNAPCAEHLEKTHEKMFLSVRENHPELPIIIMARPQFRLGANDRKRQKIIEATYANAIAKGDKNVYYITSAQLTELCKGEGTVDGTHPTDFGFASIAKALCDVIRANNI